MAGHDTQSHPRATNAPPKPAAETLHAFLVQLLERYRRLAEEGGAADRAALLRSLALAEAVLRIACDEGPRPLPHVAVIGPTQAGKSTVVNLLLGAPAAGVSPLAGFTVHPQAFALAADGTGTPAAEEALGPVFADWPRVAPEELRRELLAACGYRVVFTHGHGRDARTTHLDDNMRGQDAHATQGDEARGQDARATREVPVTLFGEEGAAERVAGDRLPPCVLWDTPDFDSLAARLYERGVLETAAAADVLLLVVSKEKYADLSVWTLLKLLAPLGRPLLVCINKLSAEAESTIVEAVRAKLSETWSAARAAEVFALPYDPAGGGAAGEALEEAAAPVRRSVAAALAGVGDGQRRLAAVGGLLRAHWDEWTAPLRAEHAAQADWRRAVDERLEELAASYRRDYLDNPQRFDTFRRAVAELLALLELPGVVGRSMRTVRYWLTTPARKLFEARTRLWPRGRGGGAGPPTASSEQLVVMERVEKLLTALERLTAQREEGGGEGSAVWSALRRGMRDGEQRLREQFLAAVEEHERRFAPEIRDAASNMYNMLQKHPAALHSLRAARAAVDAAGIALAIKTFGMSPEGLLLAPAMLAVTSMLTEGSLGSYMTVVAAELKRKQERSLRESVLDAVVRPALHGLAARMADSRLVGVGEGVLEEMDGVVRQMTDDE